MAFEVAVAASKGKNLPPGFRFHPTDEEIVGHYLKNKVFGRKPDIEVIREIDLYKFEPWDLPEKSILPTRDPEWYFFSPRDKKYPNGSHSNRATEKGYWKATGKDRKVNSQFNKIGMKKTLVFHKGRAPNGERTNWLMHEYRLDETLCKGAPHLQDLFVICRVFKKGTLSPSKVNSIGEVEEQSEERSLQQMQEDEYPTFSGLPSETSSEILDNKAEDNVCIDGSVESSQGKSNPDCGVVSLDMTAFNKNAGGEVENQGLLFESVLSFDFDQLPLLFSDITFAADGFPFEYVQAPDEDHLGSYFGHNIEDNLAEEFIKQDDILQFIGEPNNNEFWPADGNDGSQFNNFDIQIRPRPTTWQSHYQPLPCQGTASRRIRLQCDVYNSDDSEVVTEKEDSGLTSLPSQTCSLEEDDASSDIISTGESSLGSDKSVNTTGSEEKSALIEISDSMNSSECIESACAELGPLIANDLQDNSENPREQLQNSVGKGVMIPVKREQAMLRKSKHVEKYYVTTLMSNVLGDRVSTKEGMESPATMNSKTGSVAADAATVIDSMQVKATGSQSITMDKTSTKCKGVKHKCFRLILCGLKLRGKSGAKDTLFVCKKESTNVCPFDIDVLVYMLYIH